MRSISQQLSMLSALPWWIMICAISRTNCRTDTDADGTDALWPRVLRDSPDLVCDGSDNALQMTVDEQPTFAFSCPCCCSGRGVWEDPSVQMLQLFIEYTSADGHSLALSKPSNTSSFRYNQLTHTNGMMTSFPSNLGTYRDYLVVLDFSYNRIVSLEGAEVFPKLDTLNMTGNKLTHLTNETLSAFSKLRVFDVSNNNIHFIQAGLWDNMPTLMYANVNGNLLTEVDGTNILLRHPFCHVTYENNTIASVTNVLNRTLDTLDTFGPGQVRLQGNRMESFFDFQQLGVTDISQIGRLMNSYDIQVADISWTCDCKMVPFLQLAEYAVKGGWMGSEDVKCYQPENMRGMAVIDLLKAGQLDMFNCRVAEGCPSRKCSCIDQPSKDVLIINCTDAGLSGSLPDFLPKSISNKIEMYMSGNSLDILNATSYLDRVTVLDLTDNNLQEIVNDAVIALRNVSFLSLQGNAGLTHLPVAMKDLGPDSVNIGTMTVDCNCGTAWLGEWLRVKESNNTQNLMCRTVNGLIPARSFDRNMLGCVDDDLSNLWLSVSLSVVSLICLAVGSSAAFFRYEIYLFTRFFPTKTKNVVSPVCEYDVYVSFDEDNSCVREWIRDYLLPVLETSGYSLFLPMRQLVPGNVKQDAILSAIQKSKSVLTILSEKETIVPSFSYKEEEDIEDELERVDWMELEWRYAWAMFKRDSYRNIVVINFDQLSPTNISFRPISAFVRLRLDLDIANRDRKLLVHLKQKLGKPQVQPRDDDLDNRKPVYKPGVVQPMHKEVLI